MDAHFEPVKNYIDFIKTETLADNILESDNFDNKYDINGIELGIKLEKN